MPRNHTRSNRNWENSRVNKKNIKKKENLNKGKLQQGQFYVESSVNGVVMTHFKIITRAMRPSMRKV